MSRAFLPFWILTLCAGLTGLPCLRSRHRLARRGSRNEEALTFTHTASIARSALVDESVGFVVAPGGLLRIAIRCKVRKGKITAMDVIADPARLRR